MALPGMKRILLKLSGEALMGSTPFGIDPETVASMAAEVKAAKDRGLEICLVIGGGNIFRGMAGAAKGMDRAQADYMGMLATVMNALAMRDAIASRGVPAGVLSALAVGQVCEPYSVRAARELLDAGRVALFAAGTGTPSSRRIRRPACARSRSAPICWSRRLRWTACTRRIRNGTPAQCATRA